MGSRSGHPPDMLAHWLCGLMGLVSTTGFHFGALHSSFVAVALHLLAPPSKYRPGANFTPGLRRPNM